MDSILSGKLEQGLISSLAADSRFHENPVFDELVKGHG